MRLRGVEHFPCIKDDVRDDGPADEGARDQALDEAKDVLDISKFSYDHGGLALIDYLDALREARSVTSDALNAYSQTWMAIHQLSFATATEIIP